MRQDAYKKLLQQREAALKRQEQANHRGEPDPTQQQRLPRQAALAQHRAEDGAFAAEAAELLLDRAKACAGPRRPAALPPDLPPNR